MSPSGPSTAASTRRTTSRRRTPVRTTRPTSRPSGRRRISWPASTSASNRHRRSATMTYRISRRARRAITAAAGAACAVLVTASCHNSVTETVLAVQLPGVIAPSATTTVAGAIALTTGARSRLRDMTAGTESSWLFGGLLADEWTTSSTFIQNDEADERRISLSNSTVTTQFRTVNRARTAAEQAIKANIALRPTALTDIGEMYFIRGFAE